MKRYLWTAVAVLFVNANASENPFALKENLLKIDNDQEILLSELRRHAETKENEVASIEKAIEEAKEIVLVEEEESVKMEDSEEQYNLTHAIDTLVGDYDKEEGKQLATALEGIEDNTQKEEAVSTADEAEKKAMAQSAQKAKKDFEAALKIAQEKEAQEKVDQEKAEQALAQVQKEADEKAKLVENANEIERQEVAAYEKKRAEKLAKRAEAEVMKEPVEIDVKAEKLAAKETAEAGYKQAVKEMGGVETLVASKPVLEKVKVEEKTLVAKGNIDVEAEKIAAQKSADAAYLEAVKEMDQEG